MQTGNLEVSRDDEREQEKKKKEEGEVGGVEEVEVNEEDGQLLSDRSSSEGLSDVAITDEEVDSEVGEEEEERQEGEDVKGEVGTEGVDLSVESGEKGVEKEEEKAEEEHNSLLYGCRRVEIFKKLNKISEGTYGSVFRAVCQKSGEIVALKQIKYLHSLWEEGFPITSLREISILLELHHENVLDVKEVVVGNGPNHVYMVTEYVEHELKTLLEENNPEFSVSERKCLLYQLLQAVAYLHKNWVMHRDLKTSNILYNNRGVLKVCDFGMARKYGEPIQPYTKSVVTLWYRAPELLLGASKYTPAMDVWSVGCVFAELLLRTPLFPGEGEADTLGRIFKLCGTPSDFSWPGYSQLPAIKSNKFFPTVAGGGPKKAGQIEFSSSWREKFPNIASSSYACADTVGVLSEAGMDLLRKLLEVCPDKRITAEEALKHEYFFGEKPRAQVIGLMPTLPDTNCTARKKRRRDRMSADKNEQQQMDAFRDSEFRFGGRVDAAKFLSLLEQQPSNTPASKRTASTSSGQQQQG
eukprot:GHVS01072167.1.p1 GENE.GHVS01072167.1~~GHVS01072167.1.p1  ORF type:complete len:525 (-),score=126.93 GHVS01072167.1:469-2043(-)